MFVSSGGTKSPPGTSPSLWQVGKVTHCLKLTALCANSYFTKVYLHKSFLIFLDSLGSGDDEEDNDLEDSSAEIENDQVYLSKGA